MQRTTMTPGKHNDHPEENNNCNSTNTTKQQLLYVIALTARLMKPTSKTLNLGMLNRKYLNSKSMMLDAEILNHRLRV